MLYCFQGLDDIYELVSYNTKTPPRYVCKLCNNKGSHTVIMKHIVGFPHKMAFFVSTVSASV